MSAHLSTLLERLDGVRASGRGYTARCPAHDDHENSLSINVGEDGRVLLHCFAGCSVEQVLQPLGVTTRDLFPDSSAPPRPTKSSRITVNDLARDKKLPADFLRSLGLEDRPDGVLIPYFEVDGSKASRHRLRTATAAKAGSLWLFGKGKPAPYGLDRLDTARQAGYLVLVEGESDCWTLWFHDFPALGIPGATMSSKLMLGHVSGIDRLDVVREPGDAGERFVEGVVTRLAHLGWKGTAFRVELGEFKDPNELHKGDPDGFKAAFREALESAVRLEVSAAAPPARRETADDLAKLIEQTGLSRLSETSSPAETETALRKFATALAGCDQLRRGVARLAAISQLTASGVPSPAGLVDAALKVALGDHRQDLASGGSVFLEEPEPWPDAVSGQEVLEAIVAIVKRYVALPVEAAVAVALWVLSTFAFAATTVAPVLAITSPVMRCGKSTLLDVLGALVWKALITSNITTAALFRTIEKYGPTLLFDEGDTLVGQHEDMRGVLNASHYKTTARVIRTVGDSYEPRVFSTWCPKAIALIGKLPTTLQDRSIHIAMRRRAPGERLERLRRDRINDDLRELRQKASRWAQDNLDAIRAADPEDLAGLHDRAQDNWRPLLAIADVLGGEWPEKARVAARALEGAEDGSDSAAEVQLLNDIREIFREKQADIVSSAELVQTLHALEDRPWGEWKRGKPISQHQLARLLRKFSIVPTQGRNPDGSRVRGYRRSDFEDAFTRYLPSDSGQPVNSSDDNILRDSPGRDTLGTVPTQVGTSSPPDPVCPELDSGRPDLVPTRKDANSGQPGLFATDPDEEDFRI